MMKTLARFDGHVRFERIVLGESRDAYPEVGVTMTAFAAPGETCRCHLYLPGEPHRRRQRDAPDRIARIGRARVDRDGGA